MGNCQAAEAATVVIQHPCGRLERVYCSVSANQVMTDNPGHYVAVIITSSKNTTTTHINTTTYNHCSSATATATATANAPVKYLKLLRPDDTLHLGRVYRLVSFEEVLKEFATKKHVKLSRLLLGDKEKRRSKRSEGEEEGRTENIAERSAQVVEGQVVDVEAAGDDRSSSSGTRISGPVPRTGQWRPALQSIAEIGS